VTATTARGAALSVGNTGPVVPPTEIDRLLQPFERLADGRSGHGHGTAPGLGLGLSIAQAIASAHGAVLSVHSRPGGGLDITATFSRIFRLDRRARSAAHAARVLRPMPGLVLGPLLRYTGSTQATVWVETDAACESRGARRAPADVLRGGASLRAGRAERPRRGLRPALRGASRRRARLAAGGRAATLDNSPRGSTSARRASSSAPAASGIRSGRRTPSRRRSIRSGSASTRSGRSRAACRRSASSGPTACCCWATRSTRTRRRRRRAPSSARGATRAGHPASRSRTSRSTHVSTRRPGATPTSAGCSPPCRAP